MQLNDWATIASIISSLAVAVSLIYLGVQIRQNTKHTRAAIYQGRIGRISDQQIALADADIVAALIGGNGGVVTPETVKQFQFQRLMNAHFYGWQDTYFQYQHRLIDDDLFQQMRLAVSRALRQPGYRAEWANIRVPGTKFTKFVDDILATVAVAEDTRVPASKE
jgi:hypothetical protein